MYRNRRMTPRNYILNKLEEAKNEKIRTIVLPHLEEYKKLKTEAHDISRKAIKELNKKLEKIGFKANETPYIECVVNKYYNTLHGLVKANSPCIKVINLINEAYNQAVDDVMLNSDFKEVLTNFVETLNKIK